eukprot:Phypoly_transcript_20007.p1 GENE.Phypoly_transcript_20007~~Phypoly_transcript_20007.p1  ORF type:complete len:115 (+),score=27.86 Phypoly_transcript_20007:39-347(+)
MELEHLQAQLSVYQCSAEDVHELKQKLMAQVSQGALLKEESVKLQHMVQVYQATSKAETAKLRELQKAFEELALSHAELKQMNVGHFSKERQASELVQELMY